MRRIARSDHVAPASVTEANFKLYRKSGAVTDFKEFPDRSHFSIDEAGWERVTDYELAGPKPTPWRLQPDKTHGISRQ